MFSNYDRWFIVQSNHWMLTPNSMLSKFSLNVAIYHTKLFCPMSQCTFFPFPNSTVEEQRPHSYSRSRWDLVSSRLCDNTPIHIRPPLVWNYSVTFLWWDSAAADAAAAILADPIPNLLPPNWITGWEYMDPLWEIYWLKRASTTLLELGVFLVLY